MRRCEHKNFALIGAAGYVAPKHCHAIHGVNGDLLVALDPADSVGMLDQYFPNAHFFTEFERFDRHIHKLARNGQPLDYLTVCSPNYLHDSHIRFGLRSGIDVICEKPIVLNPWNLDSIESLQEETGNTVNAILQLRLHPKIQALKRSIDKHGVKKRFKVILTYIAPRGRWYHTSWKGDVAKSGGVATNIGIHFFDMLSFLFGPRRQTLTHLSEPSKCSGFIEYQNADVQWYLSVDARDLSPVGNPQLKTFREIKIDGREIEFSNGFSDLHLESYQKILSGNGFSISDSRQAIETVSEIRNLPISLGGGELHPKLK